MKCIFEIAMATVILVGFVLPSQAEEKQLCEFKPFQVCLDSKAHNGKILNVPDEHLGIRQDAFSICTDASNLTTAPDLVLIMDNTGSMDVRQFVDNIPRYCPDPDPMDYLNDPGCISGDPKSLRGPALKSFLDSALAKSNDQVNIGVVTFNAKVSHQSSTLTKLDQKSINSIKSELKMEAEGYTNYTAAFAAAKNLLSQSKKPKSQQAIIFVSDGRPNYPETSAYKYKESWDELPVVHSIFLGDNADNFKDMKEIASHTGGLFFNIRDVEKLAGILTTDILKKIFTSNFPLKTIITNKSTGIKVEAEANAHIYEKATQQYKVNLPGPIYLQMEKNEISVEVLMSDAVKNQEINFIVNRNHLGPFDIIYEPLCRDKAEINIYNSAGESLLELGLPYTMVDSKLHFSVKTKANYESASVSISSSTDAETSYLSQKERIASLPGWDSKMDFEHLGTEKKGDGKLQTKHNQLITVSYVNPYLPEDKAEAIVRVKLATDINSAYYFDLDGDGQVETAKVNFAEELTSKPSALDFYIPSADGKVQRTATKNEIQYSLNPDESINKKSLTVTLSKPFPLGLTETGAGDSLGHTRTEPSAGIAESWFSVGDSIAPVLVKAEVKKGSNPDAGNVIKLTFSESITLDQASKYPLIFKRGETEFSINDVTFESINQETDNTLIITIAPNSTIQPVGNDKVSINPNGEIQDSNGLSPSKKRFISLSGYRPNQDLEGVSISAPAKLPEVQGEPFGFVHIDQNGNPLSGNDAGRCSYCVPKIDGSFIGPVFSVTTAYTVSYTFWIYSNLGGFVTKVSGTIKKNDFPNLKKLDTPNAAGQALYQQDIVWDGSLPNGTLVGTGAFVLKADFNFSENPELGAQAAKELVVKKFGYYR